MQQVKNLVEGGEPVLVRARGARPLPKVERLPFTDNAHDGGIALKAHDAVRHVLHYPRMTAPTERAAAHVHLLDEFKTRRRRTFRKKIAVVFRIVRICPNMSCHNTLPFPVGHHRPAPSLSPSRTLPRAPRPPPVVPPRASRCPDICRPAAP